MGNTLEVAGDQKPAASVLWHSNCVINPLRLLAIAEIKGFPPAV
jgi:hypothetical protein